MISKNLSSSTPEKNMVRKNNHIKLISAITTFGLLISQSVYAADEASSGGIPGWVWGIVVLVILVGVTLLPKKLTGQKKIQTPERKIPTPPVVVTTKKADTSPSIKTPTPAPVAVETPPVVVKEEPKPIVTDALDEAKQLLAQQRYPQAVGVLNKGLQKNPERSDLMLELLAIYLKQSDHEAFDAQFDQLKQLDDPLALIQAEELHDQLVRPVIVEDNDHIEYNASQAKVAVAEPEQTTQVEVPDYTADSLAFTSELSTPADAESTSIGKTVDITPIETEFSLDDIDLGGTSLESKETPIEVSAKKQSDVFDFSEFDDFVINVPTEDKTLNQETESPNLELKDAEPLKPATEVDLKSSTIDESKTIDLVDLEFDFDDSFALDEDKTDVSAKKSDWTTDLADENFASPSEPAIIDPFATEVAPEPVFSVPVAAPKAVDPIKNDLASSLEDEFPFLKTVDTFQTRLDLARNYIELGEIGSARELLSEVSVHGAEEQQIEARKLIAKLAS